MSESEKLDMACKQLKQAMEKSKNEEKWRKLAKTSTQKQVFDNKLKDLRRQVCIITGISLTVFV